MATQTQTISSETEHTLILRCRARNIDVEDPDSDVEEPDPDIEKRTNQLVMEHLSALSAKACQQLNAAQDAIAEIVESGYQGDCDAVSAISKKTTDQLERQEEVPNASAQVNRALQAYAQKRALLLQKAQYALCGAMKKA